MLSRLFWYEGSVSQNSQISFPCIGGSIPYKLAHCVSSSCKVFNVFTFTVKEVEQQNKASDN